MTVTVDVAHFTDAGCPWCYSAEPVRVALEERYGDQLRWRNVQVRLYESARAMEEQGYTTAGLVTSWRKIHERHGMPFGTRERARLVGTWAAARAVKAAELQGAGERLLRRLRFAWFVQSGLVDCDAQLRRLAAQAGLSLERFDTDVAASAATFARDREEARRPDRVAVALNRTAKTAEESDRYTTPSYVFSTRDRSVSVPGSQPLEAYEVALQNLAPHLRRRPPPDAGRFLGGRPGELHATVEVAAAIGRSARTAEEHLDALSAEGSVVRVPVALGVLWSAGPPAYSLPS